MIEHPYWLMELTGSKKIRSLLKFGEGCITKETKFQTKEILEDLILKTTLHPDNFHQQRAGS